MMNLVLWLRSLWPFGDHMIIPERRRGTRYLTLKNAARAAIVSVVAFILLSIWAAFRPSHAGASLWERQAAPLSESPPVREPFPVVPEGSIHDAPPAQLVVPDAPVPPSPPVARQKTAEPRESPLGTGQRIMISGGKEGVQVHVEAPPRH